MVHLNICVKVEFCKKINNAISGHQLVTSEVHKLFDADYVVWSFH